MFGGCGNTKTNYHLSNYHNKRYEKIAMSSLADPLNSNGYHGRKQHFQYGKTTCGSASNNMIYGGTSINQPFNADSSVHAPVHKFYETPNNTFLYETPNNIFLYGQNNHVSHANDHKMSNIFSLQEKTSAEIRKKQKETKQTEQDYLKYLEDKQHLLVQQEHDKKKESHGRTREILKMKEDHDQLFPFGNPGGGAPNRTISGSLKTGFTADREIHFQKRERDQLPDGPLLTACNKVDPMTTELDILAHESRTRRHVIKREDDPSSVGYHPFGRPGAGAPIRDSHGQTKAARTKNLSRTVQESDPSKLGPSKSYGLEFSKVGGGGAQNTDKNGNLISTKRQTLVAHEQGAIIKFDENDIKKESYNPWGKDGAGAPLHNQDGVTMTQVSGKYTSDQLSLSNDKKQQEEARRKYLETLRNQAAEQQEVKNAERDQLKQPRIETHQPDKEKSRQYHKQLDEHFRQMKSAPDEELRRQREKSVEHAHTMSNIWGKPGNGAQSENSRRRKLDVFAIPVTVL